jgi:hypothetical protein
VKSLSEALKENKILKKIHLKFNEINDQGAIDLSQTLKYNVVENLLIGKNKIGDKELTIEELDLKRINLRASLKSNLFFFGKILYENDKNLLLIEWIEGKNILIFIKFFLNFYFFYFYFQKNRRKFGKF